MRTKNAEQSCETNNIPNAGVCCNCYSHIFTLKCQPKLKWNLSEWIWIIPHFRQLIKNSTQNSAQHLNLIYIRLTSFYRLKTKSETSKEESSIICCCIISSYWYLIMSTVFFFSWHVYTTPENTLNDLVGENISVFVGNYNYWISKIIKK